MDGKGKPQIIDKSVRSKQHPIHAVTSGVVKPVGLLHLGSIRPNKMNQTAKASTSSLMNVMSTQYDVINFRK
jgi:hypothetical protein